MWWVSAAGMVWRSDAERQAGGSAGCCLRRWTRCRLALYTCSCVVGTSRPPVTHQVVTAGPCDAVDLVHVHCVCVRASISKVRTVLHDSSPMLAHCILATTSSRSATEPDLTRTLTELLRPSTNIIDNVSDWVTVRSITLIVPTSGHQYTCQL